MSDTKPRRWEILEDATKTIVVDAKDYDALEAELDALKSDITKRNQRVVDQTDKYLTAKHELAALKKQIDNEPWIYWEKVNERSFIKMGQQKRVQHTHRGKLVNVEKL